MEAKLLIAPPWVPRLLLKVLLRSVAPEGMDGLLAKVLIAPPLPPLLPLKVLLSTVITPKFEMPPPGEKDCFVLVDLATLERGGSGRVYAAAQVVGLVQVQLAVEQLQFAVVGDAAAGTTGDVLVHRRVHERGGPAAVESAADVVASVRAQSARRSASVPRIFVIAPPDPFAPSSTMFCSNVESRTSSEPSKL